MAVSRPVDVLVAVPARNEAETIAVCLTRIAEAAEAGIRSGAVRRIRVAVAAHRCTDDTASRARTVLETAGLDHVVLATDRDCGVGEVRTRLIHAAMRHPRPLPAGSTWIFSTDSDSEVPADWITAMLAVAGPAQADLVAGLTELTGWDAGEAARAAYEEVLARGMTADGGHRHVYAANLVVRYDAFDRAGGFPSVAHGEERELLLALSASGGRVVSTPHPVVLTSGRMPGRAAQGLGAMLARLSADDPEPPEVEGDRADGDRVG